MKDFDKAPGISTMYGEDQPYKCPKCNENKQFGTLSALRMHMTVLHSVPVRSENELLTTSSDENNDNMLYDVFRKGEELISESSLVNELPTKIDEVFDGFTARTEQIMRKYNRDVLEMEEKLRLQKQLEIIRLQKQKLQETAKKWDLVYKLGKSSEVIQEKLSLVKDKEIATSPLFNNDSHCSDNKNDSVKQQNLEKQLDVSIQIAAKYKGQALDMEKKLQEKIKHEENIREFLTQTSEKEAEARTKLEAFMDRLLMRAEKAEKEAEFYRSQTTLHQPLSESYNKDQRNWMHNQSLPASSSSSPTAPRTTTSKQPSSWHKQTSSVPSTPPRTFKKPPRIPSHPNTRRSSGKNLHTSQREKYMDDPYVTQLLEPPSSQELPRKWKGQRPSENEKQLPGIDLSNLVNAAMIWPFSNKFQPESACSSARSNFSATSSELNSQTLRNNGVVRRRIGLFCVFAYLPTDALLSCALVCREWRDVSRHPKLWTRVTIDSKRISSQFLVNLSVCCKETCYLSLRNVKGRAINDGESNEQYQHTTKGCLEIGLESVLQVCGNNLLVLTIEKCNHFLTRRVLWLVSCYNRKLKSLTFQSTEPINHEVAWSLGAGCRDLVSLDVTPVTPRVLQMISCCWPNLQGLSIGGKFIDKRGIKSIAFNCQQLQVLELSYMDELTEEIARDMVKHGFKFLQSLMLTHTRVRTRALVRLLQLSEHNLQWLRVQLSFTDYCLDKGEGPAIVTVQNSALFAAYNRTTQTLMRLQKQPKYAEILEIVCTS